MAPSPPPYPVYPKYNYEGYFLVEFQQNLNHYEVGFPGYIDVSYSRNLNPTNESEFINLYTLSDPNYLLQSKQTNISLYVSVPNIDCAHCILRTRYVPHKPGEATFYQCADVAFKKHQADAAQPKLSAGLPAVLAQIPLDKEPNMSHPHLQFLVHDWFNNNAANLFLFDTVTGYMSRQEFYPLGIRRRSIPASSYFLDQIFAYDSVLNMSYYMVHETGDWETVPAMLVTIAAGNMHLRPLSVPTAPINGLVLQSSNRLIALMITELSAQPGFYQLVIAAVDPTSGSVKELQRTAADDTFINLQWMDIDPQKKLLYVLMGDENSLYALATTLFVFDIDGATYTTVKPNVSHFTFSAFHVQASGEIFALSPGLHKPGQSPPASTWSLVSLNASTGAVAPIFEISPPGLFYPHYSQGVFNCPDGVIFARLDFQDDDGISAAVTVNIANRTVHFSQETYLDWAFNLAYVGGV